MGSVDTPDCAIEARAAGPENRCRGEVPAVEQWAGPVYVGRALSNARRLRHGSGSPVDLLVSANTCDYICGHIVFTSVFAELARQHLQALRPFDRNRILDQIGSQLRSSPTVATTRRKVLLGATPSFEHVQPVWQLRVSDFRVIYDVDALKQMVIVRAVLHKRKKTTGEIL